MSRIQAFKNSVGVTAQALGHYVDQPAVIHKATSKVKYIAGAGAMGLLAADLLKAKTPEERKKVGIRDALVLGATGLGTTLAVLLLMREAPHGFHPPEALKELAHKYSKDVVRLLKKEKKSFKELKTLITEISNVSKDDLPKLLPIEEHHTGIGQAIRFFVVGGASVLSGLIGGLAANKINREPASRKVDMIKEGIFQFVANIMLCAVGASAGLSVVNNKFKPVTNKLARFGIVGAGLSIGILGGGAFANYIGQKWVNPFFERLQARKTGQTLPVRTNDSQGGQHEGQRKVEFWDAILHLDDLPMALAFAGVAILEPFIPLFFALSGYRTGIGYRNDDKPGHHGHGSRPSQATQGISQAAPPASIPALSANPNYSTTQHTSHFHNQPLRRRGFEQFQSSTRSTAANLNPFALPSTPSAFALQ